MIFFYIPSSYTKILGETKFQPRSFPEVVKSNERRDKRERAKVSDYNGQYMYA